MTDVVEKMMRALGRPHNTAARDDAWAAIDVISPGDTWTTKDGVGVMVVPVEATAEMIRAFNEEYDHELGERFRSAFLAMLSAIRKE